MHDVIIDDTPNSFIATTQMEQRQEKLKKEAKPKNKRMEKLFNYLIDWIEKALIIASLISLNFLIYIGAGSYDMFSSLSIFTPEVWYILAGILVLSIILIYCLSFFKFLQNLAVAAVTFYFVIAMLNQFAAFDKNTMLASLAATYISQDLGLLLTYVSHIVAALVIAVIMFLFVCFASKLSIFFLLVCLIICNISVVFVQMLDNGEHQKFNIIKEDVLNAKIQPGKKFIYIGLQGLSSYAYLDKLQNDLQQKSSELSEIQKTKDIMLGFYMKNGFSFYPQAYVMYDNASRNFAHVLNANSLKKEDDYILKNVYPESFWIFNRLNKKETYLKESSLYDSFKKAKFNINAYQSSGIDLCKINNEMSVQRCVERNSTPIDFDNMNISTLQKVEVILAQWLESTGLFNDFSLLYKSIRPFAEVDKLPMIGLSYQNMGIKNSAEVLDMVAEDLEKDSGNSAYFVKIDLPDDTYIYDEFCQIKPLNQWANKNDLPWVKKISADDKRKAYLQQVRCLYGKLQEFVDKVYKENSPKNAVIFIQGISGLNGMDIPNNNADFFNDFMNKSFVDSAVIDPLKKEFQVKTESCSTADILTQYLYRKKKCQEFDLKFDENLKKKALKKLHDFSIAPEEMTKAQKDFDLWYKEWQKKQSASKFLKKPMRKDAGSQSVTKEKNNNKEVIENKEVKKAPAITQPVKEEAEDVTEPLSQKTNDTEKKDTEVSKENDKKAPLKKEENK